MWQTPKYDKTQNSKCDTTQILKMWQNSNVAKLKKNQKVRNFEEKKLKMWQKVAKFKNKKCEGEKLLKKSYKTIKKKSKYNETQELNVTVQKLKMWHNLKTKKGTKLKMWQLKMWQSSKTKNVWTQKLKMWHN